MDKLKQRILEEGNVAAGGILRVDSFLNHQVDVLFLEEIATELKNYFVDRPITKVLTVEASGITVAAFVALQLGVPLLFAKKTAAGNMDEDNYQAPVYSYTRGMDCNIRVSSRYLSPDDKVLIIDDFMAMGSAVEGLCEIVRASRAELVGVGIVIEKGFQPGGRELRARGIDVCSLAIIDQLEDGIIRFR
ncbi:MAG: xanthine phosphoribosyltransferase [Methylocystaceae bacterium]